MRRGGEFLRRRGWEQGLQEGGGGGCFKKTGRKRGKWVLLLLEEGKKYKEAGWKQGYRVGEEGGK